MLELLSAGISGVGAIAGGLMGQSAAKNAARAQTAAANRGIAALGEGNSAASQILQPYSNEGAGARSLYNAALGVPQGQGGIAQSGVATEREVYENLLSRMPDLADLVAKETAWKKSPMYGADPIDAAKYFLKQRWPGESQAIFENAQKLVAEKNAAGATGQAAPLTQGDANQVFQGTQFANLANQGTAQADQYASNLKAEAAGLTNELWKPLGGQGATYAQSPWQAMSDRATTKANDLFLGLAGAQGSVLSGNTARGLQENQANIDDGFHNEYLNAYNNASTTGYNARTGAETSGFNAQTNALSGQKDAYANWMNGLSGVAQTGYNADNTVAGNQVNQGVQVANLRTGAGQAQANGIINASNATQNMIGGVFNALGQSVQALAPPSVTTQQQHKTNALYMGATHQNAAPVRLRAR